MTKDLSVEEVLRAAQTRIAATDLNRIRDGVAVLVSSTDHSGV